MECKLFFHDNGILWGRGRKQAACWWKLPVRSCPPQLLYWTDSQWSRSSCHGTLSLLAPEMIILLGHRVTLRIYPCPPNHLQPSLDVLHTLEELQKATCSFPTCKAPGDDGCVHHLREKILPRMLDAGDTYVSKSPLLAQTIAILSYTCWRSLEIKFTFEIISECPWQAKQT